ncbi:zf-HC2 domain-containing protein [Streptomonospora sp. S1-112]|uniref:Zf-HC2 domain-containing protein n=1 Tax=Streptomonospora mangrovi TaxID=2883123 RepID=A0A9X3SHS1_9ACTN|nr:zf-HC2 domain-containing protein [Streptomonospora mangrovi]MDA0567450.1 zf-HC2 domain-containing protein [Streptomonospora mangrovi]
MSCVECRTALSAELDGEAADAVPEDVRRHLRDCPACVDWLAAAHRLQRLVRAARLAADRGE